MANKPLDRNDKFSALRKRAEKWLRKQPDQPLPSSVTSEMQKLVHELSTYQVELEIQNEDLLQAQSELERANQICCDLYDFAPAGYLTIDNKGLITQINIAAAEMFGRDRLRLLNKSFSSFIVRDDLPVYYRFRKDIIQTHLKQNCELQILSDEKSTIHVLLAGTEFNHSDDDRQFRITLTDISARKALEHVLTRKNRELEHAIDSMHDMITIHDREMNIIRASKSMCDTFNLEIEDLQGKRCYEIFCGSSEVCPSCPSIKAIDNQKTFTSVIKNHQTGKSFHVTCSPLINNGDDRNLAVHIARDITQQLKLDEEYLQHQKMEAIGTLAGGIAHDFNNILTSVLGFSEIAQRKIPEGNDAKEDLDHVILAAKHAKTLVQQILTFSKKKQEKREPIQIAPVIHEVLQLIRASLPSTIRVIEKIDDDCGHILATQMGLYQITMDLCSNAVHAMTSAHGQLSVNLQRVAHSPFENGTADSALKNYVLLTITDTGIGIEEKIVSRIYEPYFTTRSTDNGNGMGLAMVYGLVNDFGGYIEFESSLGEGTGFHVYFPIIGKETDIKIRDTAGPSPRGDEHILAVDDDKVIARLYQASLGKLGYQVTIFSDSELALEYFRANPDKFDLIITDQTMPHITGMELLEYILQIRRDIPVILCTGYSSFISEKQVKEIGFKSLIPKPISQRQLANTVRTLLDATPTQTI